MAAVCQDLRPRREAARVPVARNRLGDQASTAGIGIWAWASNDRGVAPDVMIDRMPAPGPKAGDMKQEIRDRLLEHEKYFNRHGEDMPKIRDGKWSSSASPS